MNALWCALLGYFVGCINPAYMISKIKGFDIRKRGSGNAGASNAVITMGKRVGILIALFDIVKAFAVVRVSMLLFPTFVLAMPITGAACILGHIFPVFMGFRGGKGLACLGGVILAFHEVTFLIMLLSELVLVLIVDYICVVPITASIIFPIVYAKMTGEYIGALVLGGISVIMILKHIENLKRIRNGMEMHFSYLWKKNREIERLQKKHDENN